MKWIPAFLVLLLASGAFAQAPVTARLVVEEAPVGCPGPSAIARHVNALLSRDALDTDGHADLRVELELRTEGTGHGASVRLLRSDGAVIGTREILSPGPECGDITRSLALVLAMMIDLPQADIRLTLPPPLPRPAAEPGAGSSDTPEEPREAASPVASTWGMEFGLGVFVAGGVLSPWGYGPRPAFRMVASPLFSLEVAFSWFVPVELQEGDYRVTTGGYLLEAGPCVSWSDLGAVGLAVCGGVGIGNSWATGAGFDENHTVNFPFVDGRLRVDLTVPLHEAVALRFGVGLSVGILTQNLVYETAAGAHESLFSPWPVRPFGVAEIAWTPKFGGR